MKRILTVAVTALALSGCSLLDSGTPAEDAMRALAAPERSLPVVFTDVAGIREALDYDVVAVDERLDPETFNDRDKWGRLVTQRGLPFAGQFHEDPLFTDTDVEWTALGSPSMVVKAPTATADQVKAASDETPPDSFDFRFEDDLIIIEGDAFAGLNGPDSDPSNLDYPEAEALLECMEDAHVFSYVPTVMDQEHAYVTAARVDEDAVGHAWACLYAPGEAQAVADAIDRENARVNITDVSVDGDLVRVDIDFEAAEGIFPPEAQYAWSGAQNFDPGF